MTTSIKSSADGTQAILGVAGVDSLVIPKVAFPLPVVGSTRSLTAYKGAASSTITFSADEVILESSLGGILGYRLANLNHTLNVAGVGAGGMDTGTAPVSGYVAVYVIFNPTTASVALLGVNATAAAMPSIYGGVNMPVGFTASALISVWPTNSSGQLVGGYQRGRKISTKEIQVLNTNVGYATPTVLNISAAVPKNAVECSGYLYGFDAVAGNAEVKVAVGGDSNLLGARWLVGFCVATGNIIAAPFSDTPIITSQTIYMQTAANAGTATFKIFVSGYSI